MNKKYNKTKEFIKKMTTDRNFRIALVTKSPLWFFYFYFKDYIKYGIAEFQKEMFYFIQDPTKKLIVITAFRGSGKSTIFTTSYPIWAILGKQKKKFILILSQTEGKARQHLINIKHELENNEWLKRDLGPFYEEKNQWGMKSLFIKRFNAKIMIGSVEQSIRGVRHHQHRPDLIILDDIEDLDSVKTQEGRNKTFNWLTGEVIPVGDENTKIVVVGNLLHEDSVLKRLKKYIKEDPEGRVYKEYPFLDEKNNPLWPKRFPTQKEINEEKRKVMNEVAYQREYLLKIIPDDDQIVRKEHIQYYDEIPKDCDYTGIGIDLAISEKESADFTAMVAAKIIQSDNGPMLYILPNPINQKKDHLTNLDTAESLSRILGEKEFAKVFVEDVGYQRAFIQDLDRRGIPTEGVLVYGQDKRARLTSISHLIKSGQILFPRHGAEPLIQQLLKFGVEKHDDLVDAFTALVRKVVENSRKKIGIIEYAKEEAKNLPKLPLPKNMNDWKRLTDDQGLF